MYRKTVLDNGLRVITSSMPNTHSVCISVFIGAGSRYEAPEKAGLSHFIEHLCFKGTQRRATAREISEAIEGVGGILNGGTDKELTVYWVKVARPHFALALDVLVDMLRYSKFDPTEVEKERKVIIEELNMTMDSPQQRVDALLDEVLWPNQALGRDVAGSKKTVSALTQQMALEFLASQYTPKNMVVSVAGDLGHEEIMASIEKAFEGWPVGVPVSWYPVQDHQEGPRFIVEHRKTEQAHICLAVPGLSTLHPDRFTLDLLNVLLGEGMSSRLFLEIREKRGLAYDIHSYVSHLLDSGSVVVAVGVDPKHAEPTIRVVLEELARLKEEEVPELELTKAKEFGKGRLLLRMEDTRSVAGWGGGQELLTGRILTVDDVVGMVDAITPQDLRRLARRLFITERLNLAIVGPFRNGERFHKLLKF